MKKLVYLSILAISIISCKKSNDYVTFSGKITNKNSDSIVVSNPQVGFSRVIKVDENGVFKDTMKVENGFFSVFDGKEYATVYFQNGDEINMTLDTKEFDETVKFSGSGADESNFLATSSLAQESLFSDENLYSLPKADFDTKINDFIADFDKRLANKSLDTSFVSFQKQNIEGLQKYVSRMYEEKSYLTTVLAKGKVSPKFTGYENFKGGETSLDDLKGKYVYIDVWATWCNPCKQEIPFLQKVEKQFHGKNIEFVSISTDRQEDYFEWKDMVTEKNLGGIQLYAGDNKQFFTDYKVSSIPRFILIDPQGNIVDANAPRPSDPKLIELLNTLNL
ncbi:thiol-disulfide isomerase/thioredoxin [Tenacibaculum adriaticum]|uniref:Thiol-disulfide isomerase/thioredoxin n=1 Tax=Tenacibaculum adriaticum TaxID=413713 RepID=A0A5S5DYK1_9FLAO|nr:TlpA disulfide reductase family protein [Tenacibaculum adriaticum]TYQ00329.1 thiol-disulfide isomerase/thioredoxin [Tenacibaculum adriaticum]